MGGHVADSTRQQLGLMDTVRHQEACSADVLASGFSQMSDAAELERQQRIQAEMALSANVGKTIEYLDTMKQGLSALQQQLHQDQEKLSQSSKHQNQACLSPAVPAAHAEVLRRLGQRTDP